MYFFIKVACQSESLKARQEEMKDVFAHTVKRRVQRHPGGVGAPRPSPPPHPHTPNPPPKIAPAILGGGLGVWGWPPQHPPPHHPHTPNPPPQNGKAILGGGLGVWGVVGGVGAVEAWWWWWWWKATLKGAVVEASGQAQIFST